jgi:hypothetical protein
LLSARDTVDVATPAASATSVIVTRFGTAMGSHYGNKRQTIAM